MVPPSKGATQSRLWSPPGIRVEIDCIRDEINELSRERCIMISSPSQREHRHDERRGGPVRALGRVCESRPCAGVTRRQRAGKQVARAADLAFAHEAARGLPAVCGPRRSPPSLANRPGGEGGSRARRRAKQASRPFVAVDSFGAACDGQPPYPRLDAPAACVASA